MIIITRLRSFFNVITSTIAFYPTLYSIVAIFFAFAMIYAESRGVSGFLQENAPVLVINNRDTARNLLTTLIAGGLSMLVFSFSMVMLLLSQAAANYSPRVLPSLISNRKHQTILGIFLGMILYNIITMMGIEPDGDNYQLPGFSVLIGIISAVLTLGAFVYFIHSISTSIQINNILKNIYTLSRKRLQYLVDENDYGQEFPDSSSWYTYRATQSGTIQNISISGLLDLAKQCETKFDLIATKGLYVFKNQEYIKSEKELTDEQLKELGKNFNFTESELVSDNYILGFKQITEIGIKAMSPGINDPGTALDTINYLTELFALRMQKSDKSIVMDEDENPIINLKTIKFKELIFNVLAPYRTYCKHDVTVMQKLLGMIAQLLRIDPISEDYKEVLHREASMMIQDANNAIDNPIDLLVLQGIYDRMEIE